MTPTFEERKKDFLAEYKALTEKYNVDVASAPQFFSVGGGAFAVTLMKDVVDLTNQPTPSPFSPEK